MSISYQTLGEGKPLLIIHGLFGTSDNLKSVARSLADQFKVFLIDAPAHGESSTPSPLTIKTLAEHVVTFIDDTIGEPVSILGHSLGGKIAMEIALNHPDLVNNLIVADIAPVQYTRRHDDIISSLRAVNLQQISSRNEADSILAEKIAEPGVRSFLLKSLSRTEDKQAWYWKFDLEALATNYDELIKANSTLQFTGPTLFIIGSESNYVTPDYKQEIVSRFPKVQAKTIHGAGHWLHAERTVAFVKICRDFLS